MGHTFGKGNGESVWEIIERNTLRHFVRVSTSIPYTENDNYILSDFIDDEILSNYLDMNIFDYSFPADVRMLCKYTDSLVNKLIEFTAK